MACFIVPAAEAIVVSAASHIISSKEKKTEKTDSDVKIPVSGKLKMLSRLLGGGSVLLAFEHLWHGEISPVFPFLTAASSPESLDIMLHEMSTVGVGMAAAVTVVWGGITAVSSIAAKKNKPQEITKAEITS